MSKSVKMLQCSETLEHDVETLQKHLESLSKADELFHQYHLSIYEQDSDLDEEHYTDTLLEHESMVTQIKKSILGLISITESYDLAVAVLDSLTLLERTASSDYTASRDADMTRIEQQFLDFKASRNKKGARDNSRLQDIRDDVSDRLSSLQQAHETSKPHSGDLAPTVPEVARHRRGLATQLPTFNGSPLLWRTFKSLYDSVIEREIGLTDAKKLVHLLKTMSTPEAKDVATKIIGQSTTHDQAMARLAEVYEQNRWFMRTITRSFTNLTVLVTTTWTLAE